MQPINLGKLEQVDLREIWIKEHQDFTPWLAENLDVLSDAIGMDLALESQEKSIGIFRADVVAKDLITGDWVLIENQLERTDHGHLGQAIVYAAGLKASTIVWVARQFTDEHLAALDWLNSVTDSDIRFFGIQVELWRINNVAAPKFNVVCRPNSWVKRGNDYKLESTIKTGSIKEKIKAAMLASTQRKKGFSYKEIAEMAGTSEKYVKKLGPFIKRELGISNIEDLSATPLEQLINEGEQEHLAD